MIPKTLGEFWDLSENERALADELFELQKKAERDKLSDELQEEQLFWLRETMRALVDLTESAQFKSSRSPHEIRRMLSEIISECTADY